MFYANEVSMIEMWDILKMFIFFKPLFNYMYFKGGGVLEALLICVCVAVELSVPFGWIVHNSLKVIFVHAGSISLNWKTKFII